MSYLSILIVELIKIPAANGYYSIDRCSINKELREYA